MKIGARLKAAAQAFRMTFTRWGIGRWFIPRTRFDYEKEVSEGYGSSVIMAPVWWIVRTFPEAPLVLEKDDDIIRDHEMLELIRYPNPYYSGHLLMMGMLVSFVMDGNGYWLAETNRLLKPTRLWYVPHWLMTPKYPQDGSQFLTHYQYRPGGMSYDVPIENVIHFRYGIDPDNPRKGLSPMRALFREIFTDDEAANFTAALLRNMGVPGIVASPDFSANWDGTLAIDEQDKKDVKAYFQKTLTGDKRGEPLVLTAPTKVEQFGFSPKDLDLALLRRIPEERVTACLGVASAVVGLGSGLAQTKVGATMAELREMSYESGIVPLQRLIAEEIATQLLPLFEERPRDWSVKFDLSEVRVLQEDQNKLAERMVKLTEGRLATVAEGRQAMGLETEPEHDVWLQKFNIVVTPVGSPPPQQPQETQPEEDIPEKRHGGNGHGRMPPVKAASVQDLYQALQRDELHLRTVYHAELRRRFDEYGERAANIYLVETEKIGLANADPPEVKDIEKPEDGLLVAAILSVLTGEIDKAVLFGMAAQYLRVAHQTVETLNVTIDLGVMMSDEIEARVIATGGKRMGLVDLDGQTKEALFRSIRAGREAGEGPRAIAARIKDQVAAGPWRDSVTRAEVIARTETKHAQNVSSLQAYREAGATEVQVVDGQHANSCAYCQEINGMRVSFADADYLMNSEHPNGTRSFSPIFGESAAEKPPEFDAWQAEHSAAAMEA